MGWWRDERDGCGMVRQPGAIEGECALHFDLANERTPPG